jgi:hypothetical protein
MSCRQRWLCNALFLIVCECIPLIVLIQNLGNDNFFNGFSNFHVVEFFIVPIVWFLIRIVIHVVEHFYPDPEFEIDSEVIRWVEIRYMKKNEVANLIILSCLVQVSWSSMLQFAPNKSILSAIVLDLAIVVLMVFFIYKYRYVLGQVLYSYKCMINCAENNEIAHLVDLCTNKNTSKLIVEYVGNELFINIRKYHERKFKEWIVWFTKLLEFSDNINLLELHNIEF